MIDRTAQLKRRIKEGDDNEDYGHVSGSVDLLKELKGNLETFFYELSSFSRSIL